MSTTQSLREAHRARAAQQFAAISRWVGFTATAIAVALMLRTFVAEPFNIPSDSMVPTLAAGDYLFVAKWPYGFGRYSPPFVLPWPAGRTGGHPPARGDVVVFKTPRDNRTDFIKRIVGLPGDRVRMTGGQLEINGAPVPKVPAGDVILTVPAGGACRGLGRAGPTPGTCRYPRFVETLGGHRYAVVGQLADGPHDDVSLTTVPAGHYFALGDNRDDSADSRLSIAEGGVGMVPAANLVGRAEVVFFSTGGNGRLRLDRIGLRL